MSNNSIEVSGLNKKYNYFCLDNISFELKNGSIMGFIGENGAGKTTTLKALLQIIKKDSGRISVLGADHEDAQWEVDIKSQIGVVFDECHFHESLNTTAIGSFMPRIYKSWDSSLYETYLKRFQIPKKKLIKEYSRGTKMKLSIAIALSHAPKLLLLDEATSGLDPVVRNEVLDVFLDFIQDETHSILMSSHITTDLERICDYITYISCGKIVLSESKDELIDNYGILKCTKDQFPNIQKEDIVGFHESNFGYEVLVSSRKKAEQTYSGYTLDPATLEDIMLFHSFNEHRKAC